jgi:hypothetical protein
MFKLSLFMLFVAFLIVIGPLATIWAMNTLFPSLTIPYTFETWASVVILGGLFKTSVSVKR